MAREGLYDVDEGAKRAKRAAALKIGQERKEKKGDRNKAIYSVLGALGAAGAAALAVPTGGMSLAAIPTILGAAGTGMALGGAAGDAAKGDYGSMVGNMASAATQGASAIKGVQGLKGAADATKAVGDISGGLKAVELGESLPAAMRAGDITSRLTDAGALSGGVDLGAAPDFSGLTGLSS